MGAVLGLAGVELRSRRRSLLALGLLIGIVGAGILGALMGARRTATAYERLEEATHVDDIRFLAFVSGLASRIAGVPSVEKSWVANVAIGRPDGPVEQYYGVTAGPPRPPDLFRPIVVEGRAVREDRLDEAVITEQVAEATGIGTGARVRMKLLSPDEVAQFVTGFGEPDGPRIELRVVGIVRMPGLEEGFNAFFGSNALYTFLQEHDAVVGQIAMMRLRRGLAGLGEFRGEVRSVTSDIKAEPGSPFEPYQELLPRAAQNSAAAAAKVLVVGLLVFAGAVLLVGGFVVAQAITRYRGQDRGDPAIERALGMTRTEQILARVLPAFLAALVGAAIAVGGAITSSSFTPIGSVASFEPNPGVDANLAVLLPGTAVMLAATLALFAIAAYRGTHGLERAGPRTVSVLAERVGAVGGSAPVVLGLRLAFERGRGRTAVPVRSAFVGAILGIAGLIAVTSFTSGLDRLVSSPERYGWNGDLEIVDLKSDVRAELLTDDRVDAVSTSTAATAEDARGRQMSIAGFETIRGKLEWTMLEGRMPSTRDEIAVGPRFARREGLARGDVFAFASRDGSARVPKTVVGIGLGPGLNSTAFGDNIVMTPEGFATAARTEPFTDAFVRLADGVDVDAYIDELSVRAEIQRREAPPEIRNLAGLGRLPDLLAGILVLIGIAAIANALVVGVRRRRRDLAILRSIGFVRSQAHTTVLTGAVALTVTSLLCGIPLGLIAGRSAWRAVAHSTFVASDPAWPVTVLVTIGPAALALGVLAAAFPAVRAARLRPSEVLRSE